MLKLPKRIIIILCTICLSICLIFGFIACKSSVLINGTSSPNASSVDGNSSSNADDSSGGEEITEPIVLSFNSLGGSEIEDITVQKDAIVPLEILPTPEKDGYRFDEWYLDVDLTQPFSSSLGSFSADTVLYAKYNEITHRKMSWEDTSETALMDQPTDVALTIDTGGLALSDSNLGNYLTVTNNFEYSDMPTLTVEQSGDHYLLQADPSWPEGGSYTFQLASPLKFMVEMEDRGETYSYGASKLYLGIIIETEVKDVVEQDFVITVTPDDYYAADSNAVTLKQAFAFENDVKADSILKIYDANGAYEFYKAGNVTTTTVGGVNAVTVTLVAPELNEVYSNFNVLANEKLMIDDTDKNMDVAAIQRQFEENENFEILQNYSMLSAIDYMEGKGIDHVADAQLLDGTIVPGARTSGARASIDKSSTTFDVYSEYLNDVGPKWEDNIKFTVLSGSWRINFGSNDSYAIATITVKNGGWIYLGAKGKAKTTKKFPWCDIAFDVCAGVEDYNIFEFDLVVYHKGETYDVRYDMEEKGHLPPEEMVTRYKTLLNIKDTELKFEIQLFEFNATILGIMNFGFPVSVEFGLNINGSFAVTFENNYFHIFGFKGGTQTKFEAHEMELYHEQIVKTYYNGSFGVSAGIVMGVRFSVLNLSKVGSIGIDFAIGVYFDYYGYGSSYSVYDKYISFWQPVNYWEAFAKKDLAEDLADIDEYETETGGSFMELGMYLRLDVVAESEIFKAKATGNIFTVKIPFMTWGDDYVVLDFADKWLETIETGLTIDQSGVDLKDYDAHKMKVMYLKTGNVEEIVIDEDIMEYRGLPYLGSIENGVVTIREDVINREEAVESMARVAYRGENVYDRIGYLFSYLDVRYVPFEVDESKVQETYTVDLTSEGTIVHSFKVPYGSSVIKQMEKEGITYDSLAPSAEWYAANPDYHTVNWKYTDLTKFVTEDTSYEQYFILNYVRVGYSTGYISPQYNTFGMYQPAYVYAIAQDNLYDVLADIPTPDVHENITFKGWSIPDKVLHAEDDMIVVEAVYEFHPITVTVEVKEEKLSGYEYGNPGTFTYEILPGESPYDVVRNHLGYYGKGYQAYIAESTMDVNDYAYEDSSFVIDWDLTAYEVCFYEVEGYYLGGGLVNTGTSGLYLLEEIEEIKNYEWHYDMENGGRLEFVGWAGLDQLLHVTGEVSVHPIVEQATRVTKFDPNGGAFKYSFGDMDGNAFVSTDYYGTTFSESVLDMIEPTRESTDAVNYTFAGWYYLNESGEEVLGVEKVQEDRTYYAKWTESERTYTVDVFASSLVISDDQSVQQGAFADGTTKKSFTYNYEDVTALINAITSGDYSALESPTLEEHTLNGWRVVTFAGRGYELYPTYKKNAVESGSDSELTVEGYVNVVFNLGKGATRTGDTGTFGWDATVYSPSTEYRITLQEYHVPAPLTSYIYEVQTCYDEGGYHYVFDHWSVEITGQEGASVYVTGDNVVIPAGETAYITAVYTKVAMTYLYTFKLTPFDGRNPSKYWERFFYEGVYSSNELSIEVEYGTTLTEDAIPSVSKKLHYDILWGYENSDRIWEWQLDYWLCEETGEKVIDMTPDGDRTYTAVFKQVARTVTVTLDAGENATFPSTGTSIRVFENVTAGTQFSVIMGKLETENDLPVHSDPDTYVFHSWSTWEELDMITDEYANAFYWNKKEGCMEGEEDMIRITLDAGENGLFGTGERYMTVGMEPGDLVIRWIRGIGITIDGEDYDVDWDIGEDVLVSEEIAGSVITYIESSLTKIEPGPEIVHIVLDAGEGNSFSKIDFDYEYEEAEDRYRTYSFWEGEVIDEKNWSYWHIYVKDPDTGYWLEYETTWESTLPLGTEVTTKMEGQTYTYDSTTMILSIMLDAGEGRTFEGGGRWERVYFYENEVVEASDLPATVLVGDKSYACTILKCVGTVITKEMQGDMYYAGIEVTFTLDAGEGYTFVNGGGRYKEVSVLEGHEISAEYTQEWSITDGTNTYTHEVDWNFVSVTLDMMGTTVTHSGVFA